MEILLKNERIHLETVVNKWKGIWNCGTITNWPQVMLKMQKNGLIKSCNQAMILNEFKEKDIVFGIKLILCIKLFPP